MTDAPHYPTITDATLTPFRALEVQLLKDPGLLDRPDCPYRGSVLASVRKMLGGEAPEPVEFDDDDLVRETIALYQQVRDAGGAVTGLDAKDKMAILKTSSDLLFKLITMREKAQNIREMGVFQKLVVEIMETVLTPAQRTEFIEKMGKHLDL